MIFLLLRGIDKNKPRFISYYSIIFVVTFFGKDISFLKELPFKNPKGTPSQHLAVA